MAEAGCALSFSHLKKAAEMSLKGPELPFHSLRAENTQKLNPGDSQQELLQSRVPQELQGSSHSALRIYFLGFISFVISSPTPSQLPAHSLCSEMLPGVTLPGDQTAPALFQHKKKEKKNAKRGRRRGLDHHGELGLPCVSAGMG